MNPTYVRRGITGAIVGTAWVAGLFVAGPLVGGIGLVAVAQWIIVRSPGWLSTQAIRLLGFYAQPALVATVLVGTILACGVVAIAWPRLPSGKNAGAIGIGTVATVALFFELGAGLSLGFIAGLLVAIALPVLTARAMTTPWATANRRRFLNRVGSVTVAGVLSIAGLRLLFGRLTGPPESERVREPLERGVSPPTGDPEFDFEGMPSAVTPPGEHYVVDINVTNPIIHPETWTLDVDGVVERPYSLSYDELLDHDASVELTTTMICISNVVGGDLIGTGHWTGVALSDLVAAARPTASAVDVVTHAADGYSEAIPIEIVEREDILIAYGMGDRTLATEHGFPARLLVPGRYGMKMTKWITRIEIADRKHEAYWQARGWDEEAVVETMAYVRGAVREGDRVRVGGVAFAGLETGVEEISGVEVSVDGGESWNEAELEAQIAAHAWRRWRYEFDAGGEAEFQVVARAIESDGTVQTEAESSPRPGGATGWHRVTVTV